MNKELPLKVAITRAILSLEYIAEEYRHPRNCNTTWMQQESLEAAKRLRQELKNTKSEISVIANNPTV